MGSLCGQSQRFPLHCPVGSPCKHAVAVVLQHLEHLKGHLNAPTVATSDRRLTRLQEDLGEDTWGDEDEEERSEAPHPAPRQQGQPTTAALHAYLGQQTKTQLIALLTDLAGHHPVVRNALQDRYELSTGTLKNLLKQAQQEIDRLSAEPGWRNDWNDEGYIPDYISNQSRAKAGFSGTTAAIA